MSLQPLKTPEELYQLYAEQCHHCHHHKDRHNEFVCADCITRVKDQGYARDIWLSDTPLCTEFQEMTPANIAEAIEDYYKSYEEHKAAMELYRILTDQEYV